MYLQIALDNKLDYLIIYTYYIFVNIVYFYINLRDRNIFLLKAVAFIIY